MREIKFRGLRVYGEGWVYGYYACYYGIHYIKSIEVNKRFGCGVEVIPESVGQFTGLQDKNGVDIYDGDLIPLKITFQVDSFKDCSYINTDSEGNKTYKKVALVNSTVCFEDGGVVFKYKDTVEELWIAKVDRKMWEVIGNIHEAKEVTNGSR